MHDQKKWTNLVTRVAADLILSDTRLHLAAREWAIRDEGPLTDRVKLPTLARLPDTLPSADVNWDEVARRLRPVFQAA